MVMIPPVVIGGTGGAAARTVIWTAISTGWVVSTISTARNA